ncbi:MAG: AAA family ATPase [Gammaproteobacteria bacterium]|nr:AAA family ATPase [Gammaproteobacteria bacterium]MBU1978347.1 AAA family ATPase [Gammaproteobacteria bacterium]
MAEVLQDQAEGLRRLLERDSVRVVTLTSGRAGVGKTNIVVNLAAALAKRGRHVLLLDEQQGKGSMETLLGLTARYDLMHVIRREKTLDEVMLRGPDGVNIVSAGNGLRVLGELGQEDQDWLVQSFRQVSKSVDVVLVDAIAGVASNVLPLSLASQEIVIVVSPHPSSIKDAYALVKVLNQNFAIHRFHILVSKVKNEMEARALYDNMAEVAVRFLDVSLDFMGYVPFDEKLRQAARICRPVVDAFPVTESAKALRDLAETMEQWPQPSGEDGRLDAFMQRLIQSSRMAVAGFRL